MSFQLTEVLAQILLLLVCTKLLSHSNLHLFTEVLAQIFSFIGLYNYKIAVSLQFTGVLVQILPLLVCTIFLSDSNLQKYSHKYFLYCLYKIVVAFQLTEVLVVVQILLLLVCTRLLSHFNLQKYWYRYCLYWSVQDCCLIPTYRSTGTDIFTGLYKIAVLLQLKEVLVQILLLLVCTRKIAVSFQLKEVLVQILPLSLLVCTRLLSHSNLQKYWYRYCCYWSVQDCCLIQPCRSTGTGMLLCTGLYKKLPHSNLQKYWYRYCCYWSVQERLLFHSNLKKYWYRYCFYWSVYDCCLIPTYSSTGTDIAFTGLYKIDGSLLHTISK